MKKFFVILMAVLCLCAFSISDANAKTRKRINKTTNQRTQVLSDGDYVIHSAVNPNYVIDLEAANASNYSNIILWRHKSSYDANQVWHIEYAHDHYGKRVYKIHSTIDEGYVINVADGGNVCLFRDIDSDYQKWIFNKCGNNTYYIECYYNTGLEVLDLEAANAADGSNIIVWDVNRNANQKWILEKINE